jgi:hypothetical protein
MQTATTHLKFSAEDFFLKESTLYHLIDAFPGKSGSRNLTAPAWFVKEKYLSFAKIIKKCKFSRREQKAHKNQSHIYT